MALAQRRHRIALRNLPLNIGERVDEEPLDIGSLRQDLRGKGAEAAELIATHLQSPMRRQKKRDRGGGGVREKEVRMGQSDRHHHRHHHICVC